MNRSVATIIAAVAGAGLANGQVGFDRHAFLTAVKERLKAEDSLMEPPRSFDPLWRFDDPRTPWQVNVIAIPGMPSLPKVQKASFGLALAYLAAQEQHITFMDSRPGQQTQGLVYVVGMGPNSHVELHGLFQQFGQQLLSAIFSDSGPCRFRGFLHYVPSEVEFANSICNDLKQTLLEARQEWRNGGIVASEKRTARAAVQQTQDLLKQAKGYGNARLVEAAIATLETSLNGDNLEEIRSRSQALTTASRDIPQFVAAQRARSDALARARRAANQELTRMQSLLAEAQGYSKQNQVGSSQKALELALAGDNPDEITAKTQPLIALNQDIEQYARDQAAATEKKQREENQAREFLAAKERGSKAIESAKIEIAKAARWSKDNGAVATTTQQITQATTELSPMLQSKDPNDQPRISAVIDTLVSREAHLRALTKILEGVK